MLGAIGALVFVVVFLPYLLTNPYFENYQFVKDFKQGKITVNPIERVYIQENTALQSAIERAKNSVVVIQNPAGGIASGLIATTDGNIITLASAVNARGRIFLQGVQVNYVVVKIDKKNNLALLKTDKNNLQTVSFTDMDKIKLGQKVFMVAATSVAMDNWVANEGIIKEIQKDAAVSMQAIRTNISEKPVVAGGALFNVAGELIGLNVIDAEGKISAIPIGKIKELLGL